MLYRKVQISLLAVALSWGLSTHIYAENSHQGKVVKTSANELVMSDKEGKNEHTMKVAASATVTRDGKEAKLTDLQAGDTITVTTDTKEGKMMVTKIEAKAEGM
jgi:hypothetical protein